MPNPSYSCVQHPSRLLDVSLMKPYITALISLMPETLFPHASRCVIRGKFYFHPNPSGNSNPHNPPLKDGHIIILLILHMMKMTLVCPEGKG